MEKNDRKEKFLNAPQTLRADRGLLEGFISVIDRQSTQWALRGAFGSRGISKIPILKLKLKIKIVADGAKNDILPD